MVNIRLATYDDFGFFFKLKSEDFNIFWTGGGTKPNEQNLREFFDNAIKHSMEEQTRKIYIIQNEEKEKVGHLYIIPNGEEFELAVAIYSTYGGRGYAKEAICLGLQKGKELGFRRMVSCIREDNIASKKAYSANGVVITDEVLKTVFIPQLGRKVDMFRITYDY